uniref:Large ribosomal subunit protein uL22m n=1 Tax=Parascaris equorum TaxID=6256 RepID=A0A914R712_PAREQ
MSKETYVGVSFFYLWQLRVLFDLPSFHSSLCELRCFQVVWPPNYVNPETGLPKLREVFHCRESIHFSPKRMWFACQLVWRMNVDEAILQLKFQHTKACLILREVLEEAKMRAEKEFHVEFPSEMHVAEAFPIQSEIIKGARRHAHEIWHTIRYRYIHLFVRLEEGEGPGTKRRERLKDGWEKMEEYYFQSGYSIIADQKFIFDH